MIMKKALIKQIKVEKLFGLYDYEIPKNSDKKNIETVLILYGNNGSGKTTLLRLLFHLLACEERQKHKTFVAKTKFRSLVIKFDNSYEVRAERKGESLLGTFEMRLRKGRKTVSKIEFVANAENVVKVGRDNEREHDEFLESIRKFNLSLYLLGDDRTIQVTSPRNLPKRIYRNRGRHETGTFISEEESPEQISVRLLEESIARLYGWVRREVMVGSRKGESNVNEIFSEIVEYIAVPARKGQRKKAIKREYLIERINGIERRSKEFAMFGLTQRFNSKRLLSSISKITTMISDNHSYHPATIKSSG